MRFSPNSLCFLTTRKCTASCENCCFGCSPQETDAIPVNVMHDIIDQAREIQSIKLVVFSGGECFLLGEGLDSLVGHAARNGYLTRFVSNGYWATSPRTARKRIEKLVAAGLGEANFSTGDNHMAYVDVKNIRYAAIECVRAGIKVCIMVEMFQNSHFNAKEFLNDKVFTDYINEGKIILNSSVWMKFNENSSIDYSDKAKLYRDEIRCESLFEHISIDPSLKVALCCGLSIKHIPEFYSGSLENGKKLKDILDDLKADFIKIWLKMSGPGVLLKYAREIDNSIPEYENKLHICDICRAVFEDRRVRKAISGNLPPDIRAITSSFYNEQRMGSILKKHMGLVRISHFHDIKHPAQKEFTPAELFLKTFK